MIDHRQGLEYERSPLVGVRGGNLGLGGGNPLSRAELKTGRSGAGFDAFLAAGQVGASGKVIGVDRTPTGFFADRVRYLEETMPPR
jgi:hypothetical protein